MRISVKRTNRILGFICMLLLLLPLTAFAANEVVVIPLFDGACASGTCKPLKNIVTVAKANGMFTDPVAAVDSIKDATIDNPYLVVIGPGWYTVSAQLVMKEWVNITGSGKNVTFITGSITGGTVAESAIIKGASYSTLSSLGVSNTGGTGAYSIGLYIGTDVGYMNVNDVYFYAAGGTQNRAIHNEGANIMISHVNIGVNNNGGKTGIGIYNNDASYVDMSDIEANVSSGTNSFGVYNVSTSGSMDNVHINATASTNNYGVYNGSSSDIKMNNIDIETKLGTNGYGVYNSDSLVTMTNVSAVVDDGSGYGVYNVGSTPQIRRSTLNGPIDGLFTKGGITWVSQSTIMHGVSVDTGGTNTCVACDNGIGGALNGSCL